MGLLIGIGHWSCESGLGIGIGNEDFGLGLGLGIGFGGFGINLGNEIRDWDWALEFRIWIGYGIC